MKILLAFIRLGFLNMLAYRLRYVTGIITYLLYVTVHVAIWTAVFASQPDGTRLHGFSLTEMVTYIAIGWIARSLYFSNIDYDIEEMVRTGQISLHLLRPLNFQLMVFANAFGEALFRLVAFALPIGVVICIVFPVLPPASPAALLLFALTTFTSFLILAQLNFLIGMLSFSLVSVAGIIRAKYFLVQLLSGLLVPIAFFPAQFRAVLEALPFHIIASTPLQVYLGKIQGAEFLGIGIQILTWVLILGLACELAWRSAIRRVTIQGG